MRFDQIRSDPEALRLVRAAGNRENRTAIRAQIAGNTDILQGVPVTAPIAGDDEKFLKYDHDTLTYVWATPAGGGGGGALHAFCRNQPGHEYPIQSNGWLILNWYSTVSSRTNGADILEFGGPFEVGSAVSIDNLGVNIPSIGTGYNIRMGLYTAHATTGLPDTLIVETASTPATATAMAIAIASTLLSVGTKYYVGIVTSASQGTITSTGNAATAIGNALHDSPTTLNTTIRMWRQAHTYGALPATATPVSTDYDQGPGFPVLYVQFV